MARAERTDVPLLQCQMAGRRGPVQTRPRESDERAGRSCEVLRTWAMPPAVPAVRSLTVFDMAAWLAGARGGGAAGRGGAAG